MRLDIDMVRAEEPFGALDGEAFHDIYILAAAIVAFAGIALGVLVG